MVTYRRNLPAISGILIFVMISWIQCGVIGSIPYLRGWFIYPLCTLFVVVLLFYQKDFLKDLGKKKAGFLILSWLMVSLYDVLGICDDYSIMLFIFPFTFLCIGTYLERYDGEKVLIVLFCVDTIYKIFLTLLEFRNNPLIVKWYDHNGYSESDGFTRSIIGYQFIYLLVVVLLIAFYVVYRRDVVDRKTRIYTIGFFFLISIFISCSQVSMVMMLSILMILVMVTTKHNDKTPRKVLVLLAVFFLLYYFSTPILNTMVSWTGLGPAVTSRLQELLRYLKTDSDFWYSQYTDMTTGSTVINRFVSYDMSIRALVHNFFLGYLTPNAYQVGGHSIWIDYISRCGIVAALSLYFFLVKQYRDVKQKYLPYRGLTDCVFIYCVIVGILNNISLTSVFFIWYIMMPTVYRSIDEQNRKPRTIG